MSGKPIQVTAAYVTLRVPNELGQEVTRGFYADAFLPAGANAEDVARLLRKGLAVEADVPEPVAEPAVADEKPEAVKKAAPAKKPGNGS